MTRLALGLALLAALALPAALAAGLPRALGQEKQDGRKKDPVLPFNPLENAKEGDWTVFASKVTVPDKVERHVQSWRVVKVGDNVVSVEQAAGDGAQSKTVELPAKDAPTIAKFLDVGDEKVIEVETTDDKKTVAGREFACKKLTFKTYDGQRIIRSTLWLSKDVKGSGVVAIHLEGDLAKPEGAKVVIDFELVGFGSKDKTEFGKTRAELVKELAAEHKAGDQPKKDEKGEKSEKK